MKWRERRRKKLCIYVRRYRNYIHMIGADKNIIRRPSWDEKIVVDPGLVLSDV